MEVLYCLAIGPNMKLVDSPVVPQLVHNCDLKGITPIYKMISILDLQNIRF